MMASFYYYDQDPSGFCIAFLCKLGLLLFKPHWNYQFKFEKKNKKISGRSSKMTPLCKWPINILCCHL